MALGQTAVLGREPIFAALFSLLQNAVNISFSADMTAGSTVLSNVSSVLDLRQGYPIIGAGVLKNTIVSSIDTADQITLSTAVTTSGVAVPLSSGFRTIGRRLKFWSQVGEQPALFLRQGPEEVQAHGTGFPPRDHLEAEIWIYAQACSSDGVAAEALNPLIDAVEIALQPPNSYHERQTLGGLVTHAWIEGRIEIDPGDLDNQAKAVIPVKILVGGRPATGSYLSA
jgi:hypothetical protein